MFSEWIYASLVRIVLSQSVIIGPVNCTHAFNCWAVSVAACKHATQQLVTVLQALTSCLWACYWPETVIRLSLPATPQRCRETDFCISSASDTESKQHLSKSRPPSLISLAHQKYGVLALASVLFVKGGSRVLCDVKKHFWDGGGGVAKIRRSKSFWSPALGSAESFSLSEIRGNDSLAAITASKHKHRRVFLSVGWIDGYLPVWKFGLNKSHLLPTVCVPEKCVGDYSRYRCWASIFITL